MDFNIVFDFGYNASVNHWHYNQSYTHSLTVKARHHSLPMSTCFGSTEAYLPSNKPTNLLVREILISHANV